MKANEIRIGNWFKHKATWSYRISNNNTKEFYFQWNESDWYALGECTLNLDDIEPIPLTEEWLLKFGFEKGSVEYWHEKRIINYWTKLFYNTKYNVCEISISGNACNIECNYVHQLQNLYFSLTGEELISK